MFLHCQPHILGKFRSRTSDFDKLRQAQVDRTALETNLLLIRLEKLSNIPDSLDDSKRHGKTTLLLICFISSSWTKYSAMDQG